MTRWTSHSPEETHRAGVALGKLLQPGDFIGLEGDLGAGKTAFVRGVAQGAGVPLEDVSSPTFAVINVYQGRIALHHADLYRLADADELYAVGYDDLVAAAEGAFVVEWLDRIPRAAPPDALRVVIEVGEGNERTLVIEPRGPRSTRLVEDWLP